MMHVSKQNDSLIISFDFDPTIVELIQRIGSKKYEPKTKTWKVPYSQLLQTIDLLQPVGFEFDAEILEDAVALKIKRKRLVRLKSGILRPNERAKIEESNKSLFEYQKHGAAMICAAHNVLIGDEPGTGKTIQTLSAVDICKASKTMIVCPASVKETWADEIRKWYPTKTYTIICGPQDKRREQWKTLSDFHIVNYEALTRDYNIIKNITWDFVTIDEATKISNPKTKITKIAKKIKAKYHVALTGTPLSNTPEDMWSIIDFCEPGALGSYYDFVSRYCEKDHWGNIKSYKNLDKLKIEIEPYFIRRRKIDVLTELPPKMYESIYIDLSKEEVDVYKLIQEQLKPELKKMGMKNMSKLDDFRVQLLRLQQVSNGLETLTGQRISSKEDVLKELLENICTADNKVIIFTWSKRMTKILKRDFAKYAPLLIVGGMTDAEKKDNENKFNTDDEHKLMIMTDAGARGLNLQQKSKTVIHYDLPWSIDVRTQREDRVHRYGQSGTVMIYELITKSDKIEKTIDEYKINVLHRKQANSDILMGDAAKVRKIRISTKSIETLLN